VPTCLLLLLRESRLPALLPRLEKGAQQQLLSRHRVPRCCRLEAAEKLRGGPPVLLLLLLHGRQCCWDQCPLLLGLLLLLPQVCAQGAAVDHTPPLLLQLQLRDARLYP
jgi:hypothetical protein